MHVDLFTMECGFLEDKLDKPFIFENEDFNALCFHIEILTKAVLLLAEVIQTKEPERGV